jgi:hypothetical protein
LTVLVAFAALVGLASLPAAATALTRVPASRAFGAVPSDPTGCFIDDSQSDFEAGTPNGCDLTSDPGSVQLSDAPPSVDQSNSTIGANGVGITTTTYQGQTFTPDRTGLLTEVDVNLFCSGCTGTTPDLTLSIRATSGGLPTGADLASATIAGFNDGAATYHTASFASPITLTAGTQYAFVIHPTANPSSGTYALTRSGTSTIGADVYAGGARVAGATSGTSWQIPLIPQIGGVSTDAGFNIWLQGGHVSSGTFVSSVKDADPPAGTTPTWTTLSFDATAPANTDVAFQVAGSNSPTGPFTFVGPDGTPGTFFTTNGADLSEFDGFRYLEYEAFLSTTDSSTTPSIQSVQVCFDDTVVTSLAVAPASGTEGGTVDLSATLTAGGNGLSGKTIDFTLNGNSVGSAVTTSDGTATLANVGLTGITAGTYPGAVAASFAGDTDDEPSSGSNTLNVIGVPTVSSTVDDAATGSAWAGTEVTGATAQDTATVTGDGATPTGTVTYTLYDNGTCSSPEAGTQTVTMSGGDVPASSVTHALEAGSYSYQAMYSGDAGYTANTGGCESFAVAKASQVISFTSSPPSPAVLGGSYALAASGGGSGNPVLFRIDASSDPGVCSLNSAGTTVLFTGAGMCVIDANQAGDADFVAAAQQHQSFVVFGRPSARIVSPADQETFGLGEQVVTSFSCAEAAGGPGISSCTDSNGAGPPAGVLDTSRAGTFAYVVTAISKDRQRVRASIQYTVAGGPSAQVSSPSDGATYTLGQIVAADYVCRDGAGGPGIRSCAGPVASGAPIDTSQPGRHTFTVTATSIDGQRSEVTVQYTVVLPGNQFTVRHLRVHRNGTVAFDVTVPSAGRLDILETAWNDNLAHAAIVLQPASRRFVFARAHKNARRADTLHLRVSPNARGKLLVRHHAYGVTLRLWVTYTPAGGRYRKQGFYGLHLPKRLSHARAVRHGDQLPGDQWPVADNRA